ncbi:hypothetical protein EVAR_9887_1 [Eumeta japonica]|uniref:Uncharacterized protein n=1 Tax=Eumeta variegata TaxID=151549 RepID=A0A4C1TQB6_EUMVA|nr:hypothetical protein EVAR_9887_1 [Eumeta japonica]
MEKETERMETDAGFTMFRIHRGKRQCKPSENMTMSPPLMDTRNSKGDTSALSTSWIGIRCLTKGERSEEEGSGVMKEKVR